MEVYPLADSVYFSITDYGQNGVFVGAANYAQAFTDPRVITAVGVSLAYAVGTTLLCIGIGLALTYIVSQLNRGRKFFESFFLMPLAVAPITVGIVWSPPGFWDDINTFWHYILGFPFFNIADVYLAFPIMLLSDAWEWSPIIMLVALSVISGVPREVFEAASLHGASSIQVFRRLVIPTILRSRVMQFIIVLRFIDSMRAFEIPYAWSTWLSLPNAGSPVDTVSLLIFKLLAIPTYGFPISYVSAIAVILLAITLSATTVLYVLMKRLGKT